MELHGGGGPYFVPATGTVGFRPSSADPHGRDAEATWQQEVPWRRKRCGEAASATSPMWLV